MLPFTRRRPELLKLHQAGKDDYAAATEQYREDILSVNEARAVDATGVASGEQVDADRELEAVEAAATAAAAVVAGDDDGDAAMPATT